MYSDSEEVTQVAQSIIRHFSTKHPEAHQEFREGFQRVRAANLCDDESSAQDVAELRHSMMEAVNAMGGECL
jgi:hypothetical protein